MNKSIVGPALIFVIIGACFVGTGLLISSATRDPSFAVEPDYYDKAVRWEETQEQTAANAELGWVASCSATREAPSDHVRLELTLKDRGSAPLRGVKASAVVFASARAAERFEITFVEHEPAMYRAMLDAPRPGVWRVRLRAVADGAIFTSEFDLSVPPSLGGVR